MNRMPTILPRRLSRIAAGGFTLVEMLVTLVVMSVGLLGIAGLYVQGLKAGRTSVYRTTAVMLAADMADRIRANDLAGAAYAGTGPGTNHDCVNGAADCTGPEMAEDDWLRWLAGIRSQLPPGAEADIARDDPGDPAPVTYTITIRWPEAGQAKPSSYTLALQL